MSQVKVPDIGDFTDVPVIEILVAVGDEVEPEQGLITLESDKATMEVPAPHAGVVEALLEVRDPAGLEFGAHELQPWESGDHATGDEVQRQMQIWAAAGAELGYL